MARVTVEDCLEKVENRFQLVILAAKRARDIARSGRDPLVPWENDKPTVVALREIAEGFIDASYLKKKPEEEFRPRVEPTTKSVATTMEEDE